LHHLHQDLLRLLWDNIWSTFLTVRENSLLVYAVYTISYFIIYLYICLWLSWKQTACNTRA